MQFFKGYKDVKNLVCSELELPDLLALKAVNRDCRDYINQHHLDKFYRYILGNMIQIGDMRRSSIAYKFPTEAQIMQSFPKVGNVYLFAKRGDAKEAVKTVHTIDIHERIMTRPIFLVKVKLPREPNARKTLSYVVKDQVNGTNDRYTMIVNEVDAKFLVPCRAMIIDDKNRIMKHTFMNNKGEGQQQNYMELALPPEVDLGEDPEFTKSKCVIL